MDTQMTHWDPSTYLRTSSDDKPGMVLIILNQLIKEPRIFRTVWTNSAKRICADGGANRLHDFSYPDILPDLIVGDLDSIEDHVKDYYREKGVLIKHDPDQNSTDFGKAIAEALKMSDSATPPVIFALGGVGGRVDQTFATFNYLYKYDHLHVFLLSDQNLTWLLPRGRNRITVDSKYFGPTCGLIPLCKPSVTTTRGFRWNLDKHECYFGAMVSTNNLIDEETVFIELSEPCIFTLELRK